MDVAAITVLLCCLCSLRHAESMNPIRYEIEVDTNKTLSVMDERFLGIMLNVNTMDKYWNLLNFESLRLQNLAKELAPVELHLGGHRANHMDILPENQTKHSSNALLTYSQWDRLTDFVADVGWQLTMDLDLIRRRQKIWDSSNAHRLLYYSASRSVSIYGLELGNEPDKYVRGTAVTIRPAGLVRDLSFLRNLTSKFELYKYTPIFGPGVSTPEQNSQALKFLNRFIAAGGLSVIDELSIHHYYKRAIRATYEHFISVKLMDSLRTVIKNVERAMKNSPRKLKIRLSETANFSPTGVPGMSNAYISGFLWLDKLGICAESGLSRVIRNTIFGTGSTLIEPSDMSPNPDYYLTVLYKRLVLGNVLSVTVTPSDPWLRVYANQARTDYYSFPPGSIVFYYLNLGRQEAILTFPQFMNQDREIFLLTPGDGNKLYSRYVKINGWLLNMTENNIPAMFPQSWSGNVWVDPLTYGFIVIKNSTSNELWEPSASTSSSPSSLFEFSHVWLWPIADLYVLFLYLTQLS